MLPRRAMANQSRQILFIKFTSKIAKLCLLHIFSAFFYLTDDYGYFLNFLVPLFFGQTILFCL